jgi:hypothetical protein
MTPDFARPGRLAGFRVPRPALLLSLALPLVSSACSQHRATSSATSATAAASVSAASRSRAVNQWVPLFAGQSLTGWHNFATPGQPATGWSFEDGLLVRSGNGGDLTSDRYYTNFELELEWRVPPGGNSGVIYRIDPKADTAWSYRTGPEMQILDDERHPDGKNPLTSAGANYALNEAPRGVVKPANEWNSARLVVNGTHVEHWLNGTKMVTYELGSADWEARRAKSKFATAPAYGRASAGQIALQDHGNRVAFRNVRIKELP